MKKYERAASGQMLYSPQTASSFLDVVSDLRSNALNIDAGKCKSKVTGREHQKMKKSIIQYDSRRVPMRPCDAALRDDLVPLSD